MTTRYLAVSIDVDPVPCYYRIYGLGEPPEELRDLVMRRCVPRFAEVLARRGVAATFFIVGADVDVHVLGGRARAARALLGDLVAAGHELGNHSHGHPYEMARLGADDVAREIGACDALLREITGRPTAGFRAPGYDLSTTMLAELARRGYAYDSSIFPAPGYYAAKAAVMAALAVVGQTSGAVMTDP
ncbi:MAG: polysaccharide deacetylase family protein, partial [Myxococcales bacterium]|nr:polysaccharide deacetylase family protein [Myxococcales bacterium]